MDSSSNSLIKLSYPKFIIIKFLIILGLFLGNNLQAQSYEFLKNKWLHDKSDTARVNAGIKLNNKFYNEHDDSIYAQNKLLLEIYQLAKKINYNYGIIESSFRLGDNYNFQSNGTKAIEYYYIALKKSESIKNKKWIAQVKMNIGIVYYTQNNWVKAIDFFKGSLFNYKQINELIWVATQQYLIGSSLTSLSKFEEAKKYIDSAIIIKYNLGDKKGINECRFIFAEIFKGQNKVDSALKIFNNLLPTLIQQKELIPVSFIYSSLAEIDFNLGYYEKSILNANIAYKYAMTFPYPLPKLKASEILYRSNKAIGNYKMAFFYLNDYNKLKDSIENNDFASQISVAQATYEFEKEQSAVKAEQDKKELEYNIELKDKNQKQLILGSIAVVALIFVIIIFFAYSGIRKQKKISENLLLNILPKETMHELKKFGKSLPKNHQQASIMFCDIKNFSHIAETLSPEALVEMLDIYFKQFDIITEKYEVEKIKTIGDAYMCVGGLNKDSKISAYDTLQAAIEFLHFNDSIENEMLEKYKHAFYFRVGIHTGNVVSGVVGLKKYSYDIWGDAVNIAARMEQNSIPGKINISGNTYNFIKDNYVNCTYRGKIPVKNKGDIDMYFVEG